jgi:hypothetical protein
MRSSLLPLGISDGGNVAVHGVDWCDAWAFCAWAGKRLCGGFPDAEPPQPDASLEAGFEHGLTFDAVTDRDAGAFIWACEGGDRALAYAYGNDQDPNQCCAPRVEGSTSDPGPGPVGAVGCEGGFPGLVDMVGIEEWVDACRGTNCVLLGGVTSRIIALTAPALSAFVYEHSLIPRVGFRCCGVTAPVP